MLRGAKKTESLSLRLDADTSERLTRYCDMLHLSKTAAVEKALGEFLDRNVIGKAVVLGPANPWDKPSAASLLERSIRINGGVYEKGKRLILTKERSASMKDDANLNTLVIDSSGKEALKSFIEPNLLDMPHKTNFVIADPGGEIWKDTHEAMERAGYDVLYFNPYDMEHTVRYSPLDYCGNEQDVLELSKSIYDDVIAETLGGDTVGNEVVQTAERTLFSAIVLYIWRSMKDGKRYTLGHIRECVGDFASGEEYGAHYEKCRELDCHPIFRRLYETVKSMSEGTIAFVTKDLSARLSVVGEDKFAELTAVDDFKLTERFEKKTIIYVGFGTVDKTYDFLSRMVPIRSIRESYEHVMPRKAANPDDLGYLRVVLNGFTDLGNLEEAGLYGLYSHLARHGCRISFQMVVRSLEELKACYGELGFDSMVSDCGFILVLGTDNDPTAEYVSALSGLRTEGSGRLLKPEGVKKLPSNKAILFESDKPPLIDEKYQMPMIPEEGSLDVGVQPS